MLKDKDDLLAQKEVLLTEIHHRVKNNMAVISSLLLLQSERCTDDSVRDSYLDTENRVRSMALVHEMVYEQKNFTSIAMNDLLGRLARLLQDTFEQPGKQISVDVISRDVYLDMNRTIPCTLLVNELVSNAFKHAFSGRDEGKVQIRMEKTGPDFYVLSVEDNGRGVEQIEHLSKSASFGYTIIHGLARQLRGKVECTNTNEGFAVRVAFGANEQNSKE